MKSSQRTSPETGVLRGLVQRLLAEAGSTLCLPYMHSGKQRTLSEVLVFYDQVRDGNQLNPNVSVSRLDSLLRLRVTQRNDLIQFLHALTDDSFDQSVPTSVPSGLAVGGKLSRD